jgi:hypothetical protein
VLFRTTAAARTDRGGALRDASPNTKTSAGFRQSVLPDAPLARGTPRRTKSSSHTLDVVFTRYDVVEPDLLYLSQARVADGPDGCPRSPAFRTWSSKCASLDTAARREDQTALYERERCVRVLGRRPRTGCGPRSTAQRQRLRATARAVGRSRRRCWPRHFLPGLELRSWTSSRTRVDVGAVLQPALG